MELIFRIRQYTEKFKEEKRILAKVYRNFKKKAYDIEYYERFEIKRRSRLCMKKKGVYNETQTSVIACNRS